MFFISGKTRLWRSISLPANSLALVRRWTTVLVFEDLIMYSKNDVELDQKIRAQVGVSEVFFCAIPSYSARIETLHLPIKLNVINE